MTTCGPKAGTATDSRAWASIATIAPANRYLSPIDLLGRRLGGFSELRFEDRHRAAAQEDAVGGAAHADVTAAA
ncbi:MAG: hypothetical protein AMXMBFR36_12530 [Acidobacteriota bacterium]